MKKNIILALQQALFSSKQKIHYMNFVLMIAISLQLYAT